MSRPTSASTNEYLLSRALRLIRRARRLKTTEVAAAMGIGKRSYEYLEAGVGPLKFERLRAFAERTNADAYGVVIAALIKSPAFALRASSNKLTTALLIALQEFDQSVGDDMALLDASSCVAAFNLAFEQLAAEAHRRVAQRDALSPERLDPPPLEPPDADD
jgi:transcriptional regulator with XRE-family HTH domain